MRPTLNCILVGGALTASQPSGVGHPITIGDSRSSIHLVNKTSCTSVPKHHATSRNPVSGHKYIKTDGSCSVHVPRLLWVTKMKDLASSDSYFLSDMSDETASQVLVNTHHGGKHKNFGTDRLWGVSDHDGLAFVSENTTVEPFMPAYERYTPTRRSWWQNLSPPWDILRWRYGVLQGCIRPQLW